MTSAMVACTGEWIDGMVVRAYASGRVVIPTGPDEIAAPSWCAHTSRVWTFEFETRRCRRRSRAHFHRSNTA